MDILIEKYKEGIIESKELVSGRPNFVAVCYKHALFNDFSVIPAEY